MKKIITYVMLTESKYVIMNNQKRFKKKEKVNENRKRSQIFA